MYTVGDRVEIRVQNFPLKLWKVWLMKLLTKHDRYTNENPLWEVRLTRNSHPILILESRIIRKISSNFEGYKQ